MAKPSKDDLIELCLVQRLTEQEVADKYKVHRNTVARWKQEYEISSRDWWKHQDIICTICNQKIDPEVNLDADTRKRLLASKKPKCEPCRENYHKEYNRTKQAEWRDKNREKYNEYQREWRKKNKRRWREIKRASARRSASKDEG